MNFYYGLSKPRNNGDLTFYDVEGQITALSFSMESINNSLILAVLYVKIH